MKRSLLLLAAIAGLTVHSNANAEPETIQPVGFQHEHHAVESASSTKVCVSETKATTKVVYDSACKEYCVPHRFSLLGMLKSCCGMEDGGCTDCEIHTKKVLIKKFVPGPEKTTCVLKDACAVPAKK